MRRLLAGALAGLSVAGCQGPGQPAGAESLPPAPVPAAAAPWAAPSALADAHQLFSVARGMMAAGGPVDLEMYEFGHPVLVADLLRAAARAPVRLLLDPTVPETVAAARGLATGPLQVRFYPVDERRHQIDHVKLLVAGGQALVAGMNWGAHSPANHDFGVVVGPDAAAALERVFAADWALAGGDPGPYPATTRVGPVTVASTEPRSGIADLLVGAIGAAGRTIDCEIYLLTDGDVMAGLAAAVARGIRVRVILDPDQDAGGSTALALARAGVAVRLYRLDRSVGQKLHAKLGIFDGSYLVVGSANWTHSGLHLNHELDLGLASAAQAGALEAVFEADWAGRTLSD
ncbi:MAG: phospholipase D-like domain-containing protein [Candidatus Dormibacteria bacterium]